MGISHHSLVDSVPQSDKPLVFLLDHKKDSEEGEEKEKGKKRKKEKKGSGVTVKNFGSFVQISKLKQSTMLVVGWRARQLDKLVWDFVVQNQNEKGVNVVLLKHQKMRQVLDHFPSQAGYEIQWHQSRGANPPYRMHSRGDGRRHRCDPNDVMGLFRSCSVQCCNT